MLTLFIFILMTIATILAIYKRQRASLIMLCVTLVCFILIGNGVIGSILLKGLELPFANTTPTEWKHKNAIILLGGGTIKQRTINLVQPTIIAYSRLSETTRLYQSCIKSKNKCTVIISGGDPLNNGVSEAAIYRDYLVSLGIKNNDILLESKSMNTYQNAKFTSELLKKEKFDQVLLVTSCFHLKRSLLDFAHTNIHPKPIPSDFIALHLSALPCSYNFLITDFVVHEYIGIAQVWVYDFLGWNSLAR